MKKIVARIPCLIPKSHPTVQLRVFFEGNGLNVRVYVVRFFTSNRICRTSNHPTK